MNKIFQIILVSLFLSPAINCQTVKRELSKAEIFSSTPGVLIETQFIHIGFADMIELRVMKLKDLNSGTAINALQFEYQTTSQIISQTKLAIVDEDEMDALISAVNTIITKEFTVEKNFYTEVIFQTRSAFVVGGYYTSDKKKWIPFLQLYKNDSKSTIPVSIDDFTHFLDLLKQAKEKM
jgi:hypothetical protein